MGVVLNNSVLKPWLLDEASHEEVARKLFLLFAGTALLTYPAESMIDVGVAGVTDGNVVSRHKSELYGMGGRFAGRTAYVSSAADVIREHDGMIRLKGQCNCNSDDCTHPHAGLMKYMVDLRPDLLSFLQDDDAREKYMASPEAAEMLLELEGQSLAGSTNQPEPTVAASEPRARELIYTLEEGAGGIISRMSVRCAKLNRRGEGSMRETPLHWSDMTALWVKPISEPRFGNPYEMSEIRKQAVATVGASTDRNVARALFMKDALADSEHLELSGMDLQDVWPHLQATGRLQTTSAGNKALGHGDTRDMTVGWVRTDAGLWKLSASIAGGGALIPTSPPMYACAKTGELGALRGAWNPMLLKMLRRTHGLAEDELDMVRTHMERIGLADSLPTPPKIEVIDGGVIKPTPCLEFHWIPDDPRFEGKRSGRCASTGKTRMVLKFDYNGLDIDNPKGDVIETWAGHIKTVARRSKDFEAQCLQSLETDGLRSKKTGYTVELGMLDYLDDAKVDRVVALQRRLAPLLRDAGWLVSLSPLWPGRFVKANDFQVVTGDEAQGWADFAMKAKVNGMEVDMLAVILKVMERPDVLAGLGDESKSDETWSVEVGNGYWVTLGTAELAGLLPLVKALSLDEKTSSYRISRFDIGALDSVSSAVDARMDTASTVITLANALKQAPTELPVSTQEALTMPARPYQAVGAGWCDIRRANGTGGIVGDEYAAGKTLQTLLTIFNASHEDEGKGKPSMIVVTKTLFFLDWWQSEIQKFLPSMTVTLIGSGHYMDRLVNVGDTQVLLTTYDMVSQYPEQFAAIKWNVVACDEAHRLGNVRTRIYRAVRGLDARQKLAITGSAMQNSPNEMWGLMNLTVPGLLRDQAWFKRSFPKLRGLSSLGPGDESQTRKDLEFANRARLNCLGKMIGPFQLRRTLKELGRKLPPVSLIERKVALPQWQANVYEGIRASTQVKVQNVIDTMPLAEAKMHILPMLLGMRQAACDPRLVKALARIKFKEHSGKVQAILDICEELTSDNKQVVIVSQWTSWLELLKTDLELHDMPCAQLSGAITHGPTRKTESDSFTSGQKKILLLQLIFGEGIQLPEGDAVIIAEPWWNEIKEQQAIGRLRRDERDKTITVFRLIVPGSVEEGVRRIAINKLDDIAAVNAGQASGSTELTLDDVNAFFGIPDREED